MLLQRSSSHAGVNRFSFVHDRHVLALKAACEGNCISQLDLVWPAEPEPGQGACRNSRGSWISEAVSACVHPLWHTVLQSTAVYSTAYRVQQTVMHVCNAACQKPAKQPQELGWNLAMSLKPYVLPLSFQIAKPCVFQAMSMLSFKCNRQACFHD